jgi:hypothetical protein
MHTLEIHLMDMLLKPLALPSCCFPPRNSHSAIRTQCSCFRALPLVSGLFPAYVRTYDEAPTIHRTPPRKWCDVEIGLLQSVAKRLVYRTDSSGKYEMQSLVC